jgi:Cupredoxin-like domain
MQEVFLFPRAGRYIKALLGLAICSSVVVFAGEQAGAQQGATISISVKDHRFQPSQISAPANRRLSIKVKNLDSAPMEFESVSLRVEKVIAGGGEGVVNVWPL